MIKQFFAILILGFFTLSVSAQNMLEWSENYHLKLDDFQAEAPNINQLQSSSGSFSVSYEIGGLNLITTRNLNKNVVAQFQKDASYIDKADEATTKRMLDYQQLIFNLYELQARKLRQKFFEERGTVLTKGPGELYEVVSAEHNKLLAKMQSETFYGASSEEIKKWNQWTLQEIEKLGEFCKDCKPKKKRRNK